MGRGNGWGEGWVGRQGGKEKKRRRSGRKRLKRKGRKSTEGKGHRVEKEREGMERDNRWEREGWREIREGKGQSVEEGRR